MIAAEPGAFARLCFLAFPALGVHCEKAVNNFDFEVALERLGKSADRHDITL